LGDAIRKARTQAPWEEEEGMKNITITIRPYTHQCADGCCYEAGETFFVDGVEAASGPCKHNNLKNLLKHLGFKATIIGQDNDGEDAWDL
jgi:hypothetical protein